MIEIYFREGSSDRLEIFHSKNAYIRGCVLQHCTMDFNGYMKDLGTICQDLSSVFILDNSPAAYRGNPGTEHSF